MSVDLGIPEVGETMVARHWDPLVVDAVIGAGQASAKKCSLPLSSPCRSMFGTLSAGLSIDAKLGRTQIRGWSERKYQ